MTLKSQEGKGSVFSFVVPANIDISKSPEIEIEKETDSSKSQKSDEHKLRYGFYSGRENEDWVSA